VTAWMVTFPALEGVVKTCKLTVPALQGLTVTASKALQGVVTSCKAL